MEKLALEFKGRGEVSGVMFRQIERQGDICIYHRTDPDGFECYEVIKAIQNKENTSVINGVAVHYAAKETYPKGDRWGSTERTTTSLEKAKEYFNQFVAHEAAKQTAEQ